MLEAGGLFWVGVRGFCRNNCFDSLVDGFSPTSYFIMEFSEGSNQAERREAREMTLWWLLKTWMSEVDVPYFDHECFFSMTPTYTSLRLYIYYV